MAAQTPRKKTDYLYSLPSTLLQERRDQYTAALCGKIRIFDLDPILDRELDTRTPITGSLRVVDLDDRPKYVALSLCRKGCGLAPDDRRMEIGTGTVCTVPDLAIPPTLQRA